MLDNQHLRQLLTELETSTTPGILLRQLMDIPIFAEFAEQCLHQCNITCNN